MGNLKFPFFNKKGHPQLHFNKNERKHLCSGILESEKGAYLQLNTN